MTGGNDHEQVAKKVVDEYVSNSRHVMGGGGGNASLCWDAYAYADRDNHLQQPIQDGWE